MTLTLCFGNVISNMVMMMQNKPTVYAKNTTTGMACTASHERQLHFRKQPFGDQDQRGPRAPHARHHVGLIPAPKIQEMSDDMRLNPRMTCAQQSIVHVCQVLHQHGAACRHFQLNSNTAPGARRFLAIELLISSPQPPQRL
jgi:hypothetical protein